MEEVIKTEGEGKATGLEQPGKRRRQAERDTDAGLVRVKLPAQIGAKVRETLSELRSRGASASADELLADYLAEIPEKYFEAQLTARTPDDFYLDAIREMPEVRERLLRQAKRALYQKKTGSEVKRGRKPRGETGSAAALLEATEVKR